MKNFLIILLCILLLCLLFPAGWLILMFVGAFIIAVFKFIFAGIAAIFAAIVAGGFWAFLSVIFVIIFIICLIYIIAG